MFKKILKKTTKKGSKRYHISFSFTRRQLVLFLLSILILISSGVFIFQKTSNVRSANYGWAQTSWQSGASTTATAKHSTDQSGWSRYQSKSSLLSTSTEGQLSLSATSTIWTDTATADFDAGTKSNTYTSNGTVYIKKPAGVTCVSQSECISGYCDVTCKSSLAVGDTYQGGKVFYLSGGHGLISMTSDTTANAYWDCYGTAITGADSATDGAQNTIDIVNGCAEANRAARLCSDLSSGGYTDWYLPAKDQLNTMYSLKSTIGGFSTNYYWSSTEVDSYNAIHQFFFTGSQATWSKNNNHNVRCIRSF